MYCPLATVRLILVLSLTVWKGKKRYYLKSNGLNTLYFNQSIFFASAFHTSLTEFALLNSNVSSFEKKKCY